MSVISESSIGSQENRALLYYLSFIFYSHCNFGGGGGYILQVYLRSSSIMKTEPGEFVMLVPPSGQLVRMRTKSSVPSLMSSLLMSISLHTTEPSSPGSNVILKFSEQKSADTPVPVPAKVGRTARVQCEQIIKFSHAVQHRKLHPQNNTHLPHPQNRPSYRWSDTGHCIATAVSSNTQD